MQRIEAIWEQERATGFEADAVIIDYDDEIAPANRREDRRFQFAQIYRDLRQLAGDKNIVVWTAAQAVRGSEDREIIRAKETAEDASKIRKAGLIIGVGTYKKWNGELGNYGPAKTLHVIANKFGESGGVCRIWSNPEEGSFYDADKTAHWLKKDKEEREALGA